MKHTGKAVRQNTSPESRQDKKDLKTTKKIWQYKIFKILVGIVVAYGLLIILFNVVFPSGYSPEELAREFESIPLPPNSQQIGVSYHGMWHAGAGNTCGNEATKIIKSDLSKEQLESYYGKHPIKPRPKDNQPSISVYQNWVGSPMTTLEEHLTNEAVRHHQISRDQLNERVFEIQAASDPASAFLCQ